MSTIFVRQNRSLQSNSKVRVYRNLHRDCYSIQQHGLVVAHTQELLLHEPRFIISEAGRKRVRNEGRKNVHAYIEGMITPINTYYMHEDYTWRYMTYDPYIHSTFVDSITQEALGYPDYVWLLSRGAKYAV